MKKPKKEVDYSKGMPRTHCGNCKHYRPGNFSLHTAPSCKLVEGIIRPEMWCKLWEKRN